MSNVAKKLAAPEEASQLTGTLLRLEGETMVVRTEVGDVRARRAVSCLVSPELHDFVLVATQGKSAWVLAVLERESTKATLVADGDLEVRVPNGKFSVASQDGIDLVSQKSVNLLAEQIGIHANTAKIVANDIVALGSKVLAELTETRIRGSILDKVFERVSEKVQRSFRRVEEIDQLKAKQVDYHAEHTMSLRSENFVANAKELVKVDGEQIHFG
jgi:hypothetical protein